MSLLLRPPDDLPPTAVAMAVGLGVADGVAASVGTPAAPNAADAEPSAAPVGGVALKWPNDVVWVAGRGTRAEARKLGGLLFEVAAGRVIAGVGINISQTGASLPGGAVSLRQAVAGRAPDRDALAKDVLAAVGAAYAAACTGCDPQRRWRARLWTLGRQVRVTTADGPVEGIAVDVSPTGGLIIAGKEGTRREITAGDVGHLGPPGG